MKRVLINENFKDVYTGKMHEANTYEEMTEERIAEIKAVNPNFVSIVGEVKKVSETETASETKATPEKEVKAKKGTKAKVEVKEDAKEEKEPSTEDLLEELEEGTIEDL